MERNGFFNEIRNFISEKTGVSKEEIHDGTSLRDDLGIDSFQAVELIYEFELKYKIKIPNQEAGALTKIGEIADYIYEKKGKEKDR